MTDEHHQMIEECMNRRGKMTTWENNFMLTLAARIVDKLPISSKQLAVLNKIWDKVTTHG